MYRKSLIRVSFSSADRNSTYRQLSMYIPLPNPNKIPSIISEQKGVKTSHLPIMSSFQSLSAQKAQKQVVWKSMEHAKLL
jgi:hypothetical protein